MDTSDTNNKTKHPFKINFVVMKQKNLDRRMFIKTTGIYGSMAILANTGISGYFAGCSNETPTHVKPIWEDPPIEEVPPLTEELLQRIRNQPVPAAELVQHSNGATQLSINGNVKPFLFGTEVYWTPRENLQIGVWKQAGIEILIIPMNLGFARERQGSNVNAIKYQKSFWDGAGKYTHHEEIEEVLWRVLRVYPDAKLLLWTFIQAYPEWDQENPDEIMRNDKGVPFIVTSYFQRVGNDPDYSKGETRAWSFFSEKFRADVNAMLTEFITTVENSIPGRSVIGYMLGGGVDAQFYFWQPPNPIRQKDPDLWGDFSLPAIRAWRRWLKKKYVTIDKLRTNWNIPVVSFDKAEPPGAADLIGSDIFHDPGKEQRAIDWKRFIAEGRVDLICDLARTVRKASTRKIIVGSSGGESASRSDLTANALLIQSPEIDFLFHQAGYGDRLPPSAGGINAVLHSHQLHGKQFISDNDHRTWLVKPTEGATKIGTGVSFTDNTVGRASDIDQYRAMLRRELGRIWTAGLGAHFFNHSAPWTYNDDKLIGELTQLRKTAETLLPPSPWHPAAEVAVIYDECSIDYLKGGLQNLHSVWARQQRTELDSSGVPYSRYYTADLRAGKIPEARLYIFVNQLNLDNELITQINRLKKEQATLVFLQSTGFAQVKSNFSEITDTLGMQVLHHIEARKKSSTIPVTATHPLRASADSNHQSLDLESQSALVITDPDAEILAYYPETELAGFGIKKHEDWSAVFVGTHLLNRQTIHALAEFTGAYRLSSSGYGVAADDNLLMIHPLQSGSVTVIMPHPAALREVPPGSINTDFSSQHKLRLKAGTTYLFRLEKKGGQTS